MKQFQFLLGFGEHVLFGSNFLQCWDCSDVYLVKARSRARVKVVMEVEGIIKRYDLKITVFRVKFPKDSFPAFG